MKMKMKKASMKEAKTVDGSRNSRRSTVRQWQHSRPKFWVCKKE